jgi:hypothetical protein
MNCGSGACVRGARTGRHAPEDALLAAMASSLPGAILEIRGGAKGARSHWSWYAFPTALAGRNDPYGTRVRREHAVALTSRTQSEWRTLPSRDIGRVASFVVFWEEIEEKPMWLARVCSRLRASALKERSAEGC